MTVKMKVKKAKRESSDSTRERTKSTTQGNKKLAS